MLILLKEKSDCTSQMEKEEVADPPEQRLIHLPWNRTQIFVYLPWKEFKYLCSIVHQSLTSDADVDKRIRSASAAIGALKNILTNKDIYLKVKGSVYVALCLSTLLYGSEIWCLRDNMLNRLRHFHHRCARTMCRISIAHTIRHRISSASLFKRLSIELFDTYYDRRLLRWTGHVARMPLTRAPRFFLTSWVDNPRPLGCPQIKWGRTLKKALQSYDLPTEFFKWREMVADRNQWRALEGSKTPSTTKETPTSSRQDIWAELRYGIIPSWIQRFTRKL
jgi:hypothetical protein